MSTVDIGDSRIILGDSHEWLPKMKPDCIDALVTDPPAGIAFMGKEWDHPEGVANYQVYGGSVGISAPRVGQHKGNRAEHLRARAVFIEGVGAIFRECLRVMKPGAHGLVWAIPRTSHWTATALEDAGFEIRDVIVHLFGTGFPKSLDVSKAIDRAAGVKRPRVFGGVGTKGGTTYSAQGGYVAGEALDPHPITSDAARFSGWGTALKPAAEHWILVRKPLVGTVAENVLAHGTGGLNIDGCRIGYQSAADQAGAIPQGRATAKSGSLAGGTQNDNGRKDFKADNRKGRWPANIAISHSAECQQPEIRDVGADRQGVGRSEVDHCAPGCPVAMLDAQSGDLGKSQGGRIGKKEHGAGPANVPAGEYRAGDPGFGDSGGASRFFYVAKASRSDRGAGNKHPTAKSTSLMRWLIRLVTPPGGFMLDPFMGSGSTGVAAIREGFKFVGIEREQEYFEVAHKRLVEVHDNDESD